MHNLGNMGIGSVVTGCYIISLIYLFIWLAARTYPTYRVVCSNDVDSYIYIMGESDDANTVAAFIGYTLLNIWAFLWYFVLIVALQFATKDDQLDKPLIFLLQQSLFMQMMSFLMLGILALDLTDLSGINCDKITCMKVLGGLLAPQLIFLFMFVSMRLILWHKNKDRDVPGVLYISIWCKIFFFLIVNALTAVIYIQGVTASYWFIGALGLFGGLTLIMTVAVVLGHRENRNLRLFGHKTVFCVSFVSLLYTLLVMCFMKKSFIDKWYDNEDEAHSAANALNADPVVNKIFALLILMCPLVGTSFAVFIEQDLRKWMSKKAKKADHLLAKWCCSFTRYNVEERRPLLLPNENPVVGNNGNQPERDVHPQQLGGREETADNNSEKHDNKAEEGLIAHRQVDGICQNDFEVHNVHASPEIKGVTKDEDKGYKYNNPVIVEVHNAHASNSEGSVTNDVNVHHQNEEANGKSTRVEDYAAQELYIGNLISW